VESAIGEMSAVGMAGMSELDVGLQDWTVVVSKDVVVEDDLKSLEIDIVAVFCGVSRERHSHSSPACKNVNPSVVESGFVKLRSTNSWRSPSRLSRSFWGRFDCCDHWTWWLDRARWGPEDQMSAGCPCVRRWRGMWQGWWWCSR